jgi:hypothetical protein
VVAEPVLNRKDDLFVIAESGDSSDDGCNDGGDDAVSRIDHRTSLLSRKRRMVRSCYLE